MALPLLLATLLSILFPPVFAQAATLTVQHELGTTEVPVNPQRVIVFDFGVLETLDELGVPVLGLPKASIPQHLAKFSAPEYHNVGSLKDPDFEAIHRLQPDLIIISGRQAEFYGELSKLAPTIYMGIDPQDYVPSFKQHTRTLGEIFGLQDAVEARLAEIDATIGRVKALTPGKTALVLLVTGGKANAYGPGSRYGLVYDVLGLSPVDEGIVASTHGQNISWEYVLVKNPDYLLVIDRDAVVSGGGNQTAKQVVENALVRQTKAFKEGNITYLDPGYWYLSGGGLTSFAKMLADIEEAVR